MREPEQYSGILNREAYISILVKYVSVAQESLLPLEETEAREGPIEPHPGSGRFLYGGALALLLLALGVLATFEMRLEDLQSVFFPAVLLCFVLFLSRCGLSLPRAAIWLALLLWVLGGMHAKGYFPSIGSSEHIYISRLQGDYRGETEQKILSRYNEVAPKGGILPALYTVQRSFSSVQLAEWFSAREEAVFVLGGTKDWLDVHLPRKGVVEGPIEYFNSKEQELLKSLEVGVEDVLAVRIPGYPLTFAVSKLPSEISVPVEPVDLAAHYLPWLAQALRSYEGFSTQLEMSERKIAFDHARSIEGYWKGLEPQALASYGLGTVNLLLALFDEESPGASCAIREFAVASGQAVKDDHPELFAMIFNNSGIANIFRGMRGRDFRKAKFWLWDAATSYAPDGRPTKEARIALYNLVQLENLGVL